MSRTTTIVISILAVALVAGIGLLAVKGLGPAPLRTDTGKVAGRDSMIDAASPTPFLYDRELPAVAYTTAALDNAIEALRARIAAGSASLSFDPQSGYLESVLTELDIDVSSQVLVFSKTSLQTELIDSNTPRAIYFNDDAYVAWVPGITSLEIAAMDTGLGPVFYTLDQAQPAAPEFDRHARNRCLRCHDSLSLSGGGVPRFIVGSGYIDADGNMVSHEGWILTSPRTPIRNRWGGWYVTGGHGEQPHLGNMKARLPLTAQTLEEQRIWNRTSLDGLVDTSRYAADTSDIAALMVLEHQVDVQNRLTRLRYDLIETMAAGTSGAALETFVAQAVEPLVEAMLYVDEVSPVSALEGMGDYAESFRSRGPFDSAGRTLRELDLQRRTFSYAPSYLVYSAAFEGLPEVAREAIYRRFAEVLSGTDTSAAFRHLSARDRQASLQILRETKPAFARVADRLPQSADGA